MKSPVLFVLGMACALAVQAQQPPPPDKGKQADADRTRVSYSGGGIRGLQQVVADGVLVTAAEAREFQGEAGYFEPLPLRPRQVLPSIEVLRPQLATELKVKSPFPIAVRFRSMEAAIVPTTFKVLYGALRVDITERVTKVARIDATGFTLDEAQIPPGRHRLTLQVQDEKQRLAEREIRLVVE